MDCCNSGHREFCNQICEVVPVCEAAKKPNPPPSLSHFNVFLEPSLVLQLFELGSVLVEKGGVNFYSQGTCMYPCIRPGDVLNVEPMKISEIKVGDIAVYRRDHRLYAHRTIARGNDHRGDYIVTAPDSAQFGDDGPTFEQDVLGVVNSIKRKGRLADVAKKEYPLLKRLFFDFYIWLRKILYYKIMALIGGIQQGRAYGMLARFLYKGPKGKIDFSLEVPITSKLNNRFSRKLSLQDLPAFLKEKPPVSNWTMTLHLNSKLVGSLSFVLRPETCPFVGWWLYEIKLMTRYRRTCLEQKLLDRALDVLKQLGGKEVFTALLRSDALQKKILENMGFKEVSTSRDVFMGNKNDELAERLIMKNRLL